MPEYFSLLKIQWIYLPENFLSLFFFKPSDECTLTVTDGKVILITVQKFFISFKNIKIQLTFEEINIILQNARLLEITKRMKLRV